ncbi:MAG: acylneuraminate cytidylyltransferase family protein [Candidatus Omnitrophica bacterium]|nr:acylneuraminate cytidylyltransferase family protein [Candidatus Omnitrophota bacterium]
MIYGIIPARSGSKGVPGKNIKLLGGYPLIAYTIAAVKMTKNISRTIVSTDSMEIASIAKKYGAEAPFLRPVEFSGDNSVDIDFVLHAINWFQQNENKVPDYLVHLRPTTPLRNPVIIDQAIKEIKGQAEATSLRSGHPAAESPFKWFLRDDQGYFKDLLSGYSNDQTNAPRQSFSTVYIPDGYVDVLKISFIRDSHSLHGNKMIGFISPVCTEVDTIEDFKFLEYELKNKSNLVYEYLNENYPKER